jgi:nucleotidyltransferase substrate binding protein (TIGR01987 family)
MSKKSTDFPLLKDLTKAIANLKYALRLKKTEIVRDSAIKRFEISFDLAWKSIQVYARREGLECQSPRACLKVAFKLGLIAYEKKWLRMLADRNRSVHTYKETFAKRLFGRLPEYADLLEGLAKKIKS